VSPVTASTLPVVLATGGGTGSLVSLSAAVILGLMFLGLGTYAYKHVRGDGIEWPDEQTDDEEDGVRRGGSDDEWDYY